MMPEGYKKLIDEGLDADDHIGRQDLSNSHSIMIRFMKAMDQALSEGKQEYTCPICGGTVRVSIAEYNGHAHAYCDGCGMVLME